VTVVVHVDLNGIRVPVELDADALATIAAALPHVDPPPPSPYMTIPEAAEFLRCSRQRVDDLLSARCLERVKDGSRTLLRRSDVLAYLESARNGRRVR
jgi:excisionase family DNA binding protein